MLQVSSFLKHMYDVTRDGQFLLNLIDISANSFGGPRLHRKEDAFPLSLGGQYATSGLLFSFSLADH